MNKNPTTNPIIVIILFVGFFVGIAVLGSRMAHLAKSKPENQGKSVWEIVVGF